MRNVTELAARIILDNVHVEQRTGGAEPQLHSSAGGYEERADLALHALATAVVATVQARKEIAAMPTREEWLGGQRTKYVQVDEVLAFIDEALKP